MADSFVPKDPAPRRGVIKVLVCFTPAALGYCDYLVAQDRANGVRNANRSQVIRRALRARQMLRHDLRGTTGSLLLLKELLLSQTPPTQESNAELAEIVDAFHEQLTRLSDPDDPEPLAGNIHACSGP